MNFYTYMWLREDGTPYYAGKGKGMRGFTSAGHRVACPIDKKQIILQEWPSEKDAFTAEIFLISYYGRIDLGTGCLANLTDGGDSPPNGKGLRKSKLTRERMSASLLGNSRSRGKKRSIETRSKISAATKGNTIWLGKKHSPKTRAKMRLARLGKKRPPFSDEWKKNLSLARKGKPWSEARRNASRRKA